MARATPGVGVGGVTALRPAPPDAHRGLGRVEHAAQLDELGGGGRPPPRAPGGGGARPRTRRPPPPTAPGRSSAPACSSHVGVDLVGDVGPRTARRRRRRRRVRGRQPGPLLAHDVGAETVASRRLPISWARVDLPVPGSPPTTTRRTVAASRFSTHWAKQLPGAPLAVRRVRPPRLLLDRAETGDLGPDLGAVGDVEAQQRRRQHGAGRLLVGADEAVGLGAGPESLEVHDQEGHVVGHVAEAEARRRTRCSRAPGGRRRGRRRRRPAGRRARRRRTRRRCARRTGPTAPPGTARRARSARASTPPVEHGAGEGPQLVEVLLPPRRHRVAGGRRVDGRRSVGVTVEPGQQPAELAMAGGTAGSCAADQRREPSRRRHAAHDDEMVDRPEAGSDGSDTSATPR